jgi:hypothetical protein
MIDKIIIVRYMDSIPSIIPLLEKEYRSTTRKLNEINQELRSSLTYKTRVFFFFFFFSEAILDGELVFDLLKLSNSSKATCLSWG